MRVRLRGSFSLSHARMQNYACTKTHTLGVFHLRCEARPPSAFLTCNHVQICTGRQGEGERHVNLCGCFLFFFFVCECFFFFFFSFFCLKNWLPPISDTRDPNHPLKPLQNERRGSKNISSALPPSSFFSLSLSLLCWKLNLAPGARRRRRRVFTCYQVTTSV